MHQADDNNLTFLEKFDRHQAETLTKSLNLLQMEHITSEDYMDMLEHEKRELQQTINDQMRLVMIQGLSIGFLVLIIGVLMSKLIYFV